MIGSARTDQKLYDVVIRTQDEFDRLVASSNWLGARTVGLIRLDMSDSYQVKLDTRLVIPTNVKEVAGIGEPALLDSKFGVFANGHLATISNVSISATAGTAFDNFLAVNNCSGRLMYGTLDPGNVYPVFLGCSNLNNCTGQIYRSNSPTFKGCYNLTKCSAMRIAAYGDSEVGITDVICFDTCTDLILCSVSSNFSVGAKVRCYHKCTNLIGCKTYVVNMNLQYRNSVTYFFDQCTGIINCLMTDGITNIEGGAIFQDCNRISNSGVTAGKTSAIPIFGGTNTHVDSETVG